mgnify:FL=1
MRKMAGSPGVCVLMPVYIVILTVAVRSPQFRETYLHIQETEFLPFWAFGGMLPAFVTLTLILGISPLFAGDIQSRTWEEFSTCVRGRDSLCRARSAAAVLFSVLVNFAYQGVTFLFGLFRGPSQNWEKAIGTVYPGTDFKMNIGAYYALAALSIFLGSLVIAALTAYTSARSKTAVAPCAAAVLFWAVEAVFQTLGGATPIRKYLYHINVCKAMNPVMNLYPGALAPFNSPPRAIEIMLLCFAGAVGLLLWHPAHWHRSLI